MKKNNPMAVALRYDGTGAPRITAKGEGSIAQQIIATAQKHGIPLEQNEELTTLLAGVQLNKEIPPSLYMAVAQILAFLYYVNENKLSS